MRASLLALLAWQAGTAAHAPSLLSPAALRDRVAAAMTAATHLSVTDVDDRTFRTVNADGTELTVSTDNAYASYEADPGQLDAIVARYAGLLATPIDNAAGLERLVVIVRPSDYLTRTLPAGASTVHFLEPRPFAGDLSLFLAVDSPDTLRLAGPDDLTRWKIGSDEAWAHAIVNVKARVGPLVPTHFDDDNGVNGFTATSGLAPSVLADPAVCGPAALDGFDHQLVLLYTRDMFIYVLPSNAVSVRQFWATVKSAASAKRALSSTVVTCKAGRWSAVPTPKG